MNKYELAVVVSAKIEDEERKKYGKIKMEVRCGGRFIV